MVLHGPRARASAGTPRRGTSPVDQDSKPTPDPSGHSKWSQSADTPVGRVTALRRSLIARSSPRDHAVPPRASFRVAWLASDTLWDVLPVAPVGAREDPLIPSDQLLFGHDSYVSLRS